MSCKTPFSNGESERGSTACLRSENWWVNRLGVGTCLSGLGPCALSTKLPRCPPPCGLAHEFVHRSLPVIKSFSLALGTFYSFPDSFSTTAWPVAAQRKHGGLEITMVAWKFFTPRGFPWAGHFVAVYTFRPVSLN